MDKMIGKRSVQFEVPPCIIGAASVAGEKEGAGKFGKYYDIIEDDPLFGGKTWEEAESKMQHMAADIAIRNAGLESEDIRYIVAGDLLGQKARLAHLHLPPAVPLPAQQLYAVVRVNVQHFFFAAVVAQPLGHAANAVAAHNPPASVRVEHLHAGIRAGGNGRADANHAIRPDGQVPTGQPSCQFWNIIPQAAALVQINIIVAAAMHFCKLHKYFLHFHVFLHYHIYKRQNSFTHLCH